MSTPEPCRSGTVPVARWIGSMMFIQASPVSSSEVSTTPPLPVRSRSRNAASTPINDHIGTLQDQPAQPPRVLAIGKIDRDAALGPVDRVERRRGALLERRPPAAGGVAALRVLDLDHLGPEFAEDHPGIGRCDRMAD